MVYLKIMKQSRLRLSFLAILLLASFALPACTPVVAARGHKLSEEDIALLDPGITQDDIISKIGTPTAQSTFDQHEWYYVSELTEQTAFFAPTVKERRVTVLRFDDNDTLQDIKTLSAKDGQTIAMDKNATPTTGQDYTLLQQLMGNVGKFNGNTGK